MLLQVQPLLLHPRWETRSAAGKCIGLMAQQAQHLTVSQLQEAAVSAGSHPAVHGPVSSHDSCHMGMRSPVCPVLKQGSETSAHGLCQPWVDGYQAVVHPQASSTSPCRSRARLRAVEMLQRRTSLRLRACPWSRCCRTGPLCWPVAVRCSYGPIPTKVTTYCKT